MNADEQILQLPHIGLNSRELLPEVSGIYYVLDEKSIIWYIGQAKNLRSRWTGKSHHRFYQLQKQRQKQFIIYYEMVAAPLLDAKERQLIEQYNPHLNGTKVKVKKLNLTETLLRETLSTLAQYSFILGVEPPRKEDLKFIEDASNWRDKWRVQKAVLPLSVIHICINLDELQKGGKDWRLVISFLRKVFKKRSNYADNWACQNNQIDEYAGIFFLRRLLVNGFAVEVYGSHQGVVELIQEYELTQLCGVNIRAIDEASLAILQNKCLLNIVGISVNSNNQNESDKEPCIRAIKRLSPYKADLVKLLFNEDINTSKLPIFPTEQPNKEQNNTGLPIRLANLAAKKEYLKALLAERGLDLNCYQVNKYLERIPRDENYVDNNQDKRMTVYVKSFMYPDLREPTHYSSYIYGSKGVKYQSRNLVDCPYK